MSDTLPVSSFEISGYRAIGRLEIPDLRRVNLFVGKNNAGKTSLLKALQLYLHRNARTLSAVVLEIVRDHSDLRPPPFGSRENEPADLQIIIDSVEALFHGSFDEGPIRPIRLTPEPMPSTGLSIHLPWTQDVALLEPGEAPARPLLIDPEVTVLELVSEARNAEIPLDWFGRRVAVPSGANRTPALSIPSTGLDPVRTRQMWDDILVAGEEGLVEDAPRTVIPELERVLLVGEGRSRTVLCKLKNLTRPIPIRSMGDGTNRVFGLAVALVHARGGAVLIDEVENGLHYSIQNEVWDAIVSLAEALDVQVFATTHSWETVVAFQHAANRSAADGMLYRLDREPDGQVYAERYTEEEVAIAADQQIEVR